MTEDYYFVDKTEMIKELLTYKIEVTLITRPRRFGKTLNMSMLRYFFEKTEPENLESFYHRLILGLVVVLREQYQIRSNRESGEGRYDMMLFPKEKKKTGILLEFKIKEGKETLDHAAEQALKQIEQRKYEVELQQMEIPAIIKYGIAFDKKKIAIKAKEQIIKKNNQENNM